MVVVDTPKARILLSAGRQSEQRFEVIGAPASLTSLDVEAGFGGFFLFDQIHGDASQDGEVLGAVAYANAAIIFGEGISIIQ